MSLFLKKFLIENSSVHIRGSTTTTLVEWLSQFREHIFCTWASLVYPSTTFKDIIITFKKIPGEDKKILLI